MQSEGQMAETWTKERCVLKQTTKLQSDKFSFDSAKQEFQYLKQYIAECTGIFFFLPT